MSRIEVTAARTPLATLTAVASDVRMRGTMIWSPDWHHEGRRSLLRAVEIDRRLPAVSRENGA